MFGRVSRRPTLRAAGRSPTTPACWFWRSSPFRAWTQSYPEPSCRGSKNTGIDHDRHRVRCGRDLMICVSGASWKFTRPTTSPQINVPAVLHMISCWYSPSSLCAAHCRVARDTSQNCSILPYRLSVALIELVRRCVPSSGRSRQSRVVCALSHVAHLCPPPTRRTSSRGTSRGSATS